MEKTTSSKIDPARILARIEHPTIEVKATNGWPRNRTVLQEEVRDACFASRYRQAKSETNLAHRCEKLFLITARHREGTACSVTGQGSRPTSLRKQWRTARFAPGAPRVPAIPGLLN